MKPAEFTYRVLPNEQVQISNKRGQTIILNRVNIEKALGNKALPADFRRKYMGALAALDAAKAVKE
jgi:hypothetical protein